MLTRSLWLLDEAELLPLVKYGRDIKLVPREGSSGVLCLLKDSDRLALRARLCCGPCLPSPLRRGFVVPVIRNSVVCGTGSALFIGKV